MLLREKSATFVASEWLSDEEGKMEVVMKERDEAEALVEQLNNTVWHPPLISLVATLNVVPSLSKSSVVGKSGLKDSKEGKVEAGLHFPSSCPVYSSKASASEEQCGKTKETLKEDLGGMMTKKKVSGRTSEEKVRQHMMNYVIEKIQRIDVRIRLTKEEQHFVQEEIEVLDKDIVKLEEEVEVCRQNCPSRSGVVFPSMDIRYKVVKSGNAQLDEKLNLDDQEDKEAGDDLAIEQEVDREADSRAVEESHLKEILDGKTKAGSQSELEDDTLDVPSSNPISGLRETLEVVMKDNTMMEHNTMMEDNTMMDHITMVELNTTMEDNSMNEKGTESWEEKHVKEVETGNHPEADQNEQEAEQESGGEAGGGRLDVQQRSTILVSKGAEVIIDCDSD